MKANELFAANGILATTMTDIANALGMSKKTLYMDFKNKSDLVNQLYRGRVDQLETLVNGIVNGEEHITHKLIKYLEVVSNATVNSSAKVYADIQSDYPELNDYITKYLSNSIYKRFGTLVNQAKEQGALNANAQAESLSLMYSSAIRNYLNGESARNEYSNADPIDIYHQNLITIFRGMLNEENLKTFDLTLADHELLNKYAG